MLSARGLTFGYTDGEPLIEEFTEDFLPGELVAIRGASGRGKSTLMYLLGLMLRPASGTLVIDGEDASSAGDRRRAHLRAHRFGFVFQDAVLDPTRTVLDNVLESTLYRDERRADLRPRALSLLTRFGVELRAEARPGEVSGGQAQRIALSRALLGAPRYVLADEPTGNLDPDSSSIVIDAFRRHAHDGGAVVIVTHDPAIAERCDRSVTL